MRRPQWALPILLASALAAGAGAAGANTPNPARAIPDGPAQEVPPGYIQVQGRILFIDRNSDRSHAAGGLKVEIWDKDERSFSTGDKLDETVTDASGFFSSGLIRNVDFDGPGGQEGTQDVFLKLFTNNGDVKVFQTGTSREYVWASYDIDPRDGIRRNVPDGLFQMPTLYVMENTKDVEALWTFVNLVEGWRFMEAATGEPPGPVTAYWSKTSQDGPRYDQAERAIYLRDADASFANVVVQQEAYALLHNIYDDLPAAWASCTAGPTEDLRQATDPACAFVQGFATFFSLAVFEDPSFASLSLRGENLDLVSSGTPGWADGDSVPGRVAGAFWDMHEGDQTIEFYDTWNGTFADIWDVFADGAPETMASWWQGWLDGGKDACGALGSLFQNTIDYNTPPVVAALTEIRLLEDTTFTLDLKTLATDAECPSEALSFILTTSGAPEAGIVLEGDGVLTVTPEENWFGDTAIRLTISDGPATVVLDVPVIVEPVNDMPEVMPRLQNRQVRHGEVMTFNLLPHGRDVEDAAYLLTWDVEVESGDAPYLTITGQGTTTLTFALSNIVFDERTFRVVFVVRDTEGGEGRQPVALTWTARPNNPPYIRWERFHQEYRAAKNHKILVDLTGVAGDSEDDDNLLAWYASGVDHAQVGGEGTQQLEFDPDVDFVGFDVVELEVRDFQGASATGVITLTWDDPDLVLNQPPQILRNRLLGKTVGTDGLACYLLGDKAIDPDDPVQSLRWFATEFNSADVRVSGQGTQQLCLASRPAFQGCLTTKFVVMDPKGAEDNHTIRTCWRKIVLYLPSVTTRKR